MDKQLISIVIPTLNEAEFLPKLLHDLVVQQDKHFEVIVVDGNSNDDTIKKAREFKDKINLSTHTVKKRNASFQRNYGAQAAVSKYVVFIDADTRVARNFTQKLRTELHKNWDLILIPQYLSYELFFQSKTVLSALNLLIEASQKTSKPLAMAGCLILERNFFLHMHGFNEKVVFAEDCDLVRRAKKAGVNARITKNISVKLSMRRFQKEGVVTSLGKSLIGTIQGLGNKGTRTKIFEYETGGHAYSKGKVKQKSLEEEMKRYLDKVKKIMSAI